MRGPWVFDRCTQVCTVLIYCNRSLFQNHEIILTLFGDYLHCDADIYIDDLEQGKYSEMWYGRGRFLAGGILSAFDVSRMAVSKASEFAQSSASRISLIFPRNTLFCFHWLSLLSL